MANRIFLIIFVFLVSIGVVAQDAGKTDELKTVDIIMGVEKIIKVDFVPNAQFATPANESLVSVKVAPSKKEILITGLKAGETSLTLRDTAGDIKVRYLLKVTASDQSKVIMQLKELLSDVEGLEIGIKGDSVYVGGFIVVPSDIGKVVVILERDAYKDVIRLVELSPQTQLVIAKRMQDEIQKSGFKDVTVRVVNGNFWIEGVVGSADESTRVEQIVNAYLPDRIQNLAKRMDAVQSATKKPFENLLTINIKPKPEPAAKIIKITSQFVELSKAYNRVFGFTWAPFTGPDGGTISIGRGNAGGVTTSSSNALTATISGLFPKLNSAKNAGYARVLSSGVVIVKDGKQATVTKETKTPYSIGTLDATKGATSTAGYKMEVTPSVLQDEKINLVLFLRLGSDTPSTPPINSEDTVKTEMIVKNQESAVVGGILSSKSGTSFDKPQTTVGAQAGAGTPLFSFIKSKEYYTERVQYVFFITPEIMESASTGTSEIERKFRKKGR
jgi:pilus assembly protein CpaC